MQILNANTDDSSTPILSPVISEQLDEMLEGVDEMLLENNNIVGTLHVDYQDMMKDPSFSVERSRHDRISYLLSKHGIYDVEQRSTLRESLIEKLEDAELEQSTNFTEEIAKLPKWNINNLPNGLMDGQMTLYRRRGKVVISKWSKDTHTWANPRELSEMQFKNGYGELDILDLMRKTIQYEHAITFAHPFLEKGTRILIIGYNSGDDPNVAAQRVIDEYMLDATYMDLFTMFIEEIEKAVQSKRIGYGPTPEEIAKLPKWKDRNKVISLGDYYVRAFQKEGEVVTAQWRDTSQTWTRPTRITELEYKNGDRMFWWDGINALEFVRKSIQYEYASVFETHGIQKKSVLIGYNYGDDPFVTAKRIVDEYELNTIYVHTIIRLLQEAEEVIRQKTGVPPTKAKKRSDSGDKPTPEEIAKLPKWQLNKQISGFYEGQIKMMQKDGSVVQTMWSATSQTWAEPIQFTESDFDRSDLEGWGGINVLDFLRTEIRYDHVLVFQVVNDGPLVLIGYNYGDDPHAVAQGVIDKYMLDEKDLDRVADSIIQTIERHGGRFTHPPKRSQSFPRQESLGVAIVVVYIACSVIISMFKGAKTGENRQFTRKTVYVKSSATKRLNQGKRLNGILTRSGVQYIDFERKIGQPTAMYKIKSSNGEVYVPLNIKGREEAIEKAIASIKIAVGIENFDEEIELPSTNTKQVKTAPPPVSSSAPTRIPLKKKKESLSSSTLWQQSLHDIVGKTGSSELLISVLVSVIYIVSYYPSLPKDCTNIDPEMCKFFAHNGECEGRPDPFAALMGITKDNCRLSCNACYEGKGNLFRLKVVLTQFCATFIQMFLLCIVTRAYAVLLVVNHSYQH